MTTQIFEYLPDSALPAQPGYVYLALWPSNEIPTPRIALGFLRAKRPTPIPLLPVQWGANLTVIVEANTTPRMWFGRRDPSGNWESDLAQIIRVLAENGIEAELSLENRFPAPLDVPSTDTQ